MSGVTQALETSFNTLEKKVTKVWDKYSSGNTPSLLAAQRSLLLLEDVKSELSLLKPAQAKALESRYRTLYQAAGANGKAMGRELLKSEAGVERLNNTTVPSRALAAQARESLNALSRYGQEFSGNARRLLGQGIALGFGVRKTASLLRQELGVTQAKAEAMTRTETMQAQNAALKEQYRVNGIKLVSFNATNDSRICPYCAARNMRVYKLAEVIVPLHVSCRCCLTPFKQEWLKDEPDPTFAATFRARTMEQVKAPNYGVSPFEKALGMSKPPPVQWTPEPIAKTASYEEELEFSEAMRELYPELFPNRGLNFYEWQYRFPEEYEAAVNQYMVFIELKVEANRRTNATLKKQQKQQRTVWKGVPQDIRRVADAYGQPEIIRPIAARSAYTECSMDRPPILHMDYEKDFRGVYHHEYGHFVDWKLFNGDGFFSSRNLQAVRALVDDNDFITEANFKQGRAMLKRSNHLWYNDLAGSVTQLRVGGGHPAEYLKVRENRNSEAVANIMAIRASGDPNGIAAIKLITPDFYWVLVQELDLDN